MTDTPSREERIEDELRHEHATPERPKNCQKCKVLDGIAQLRADLAREKERADELLDKIEDFVKAQRSVRKGRA